MGGDPGDDGCACVGTLCAGSPIVAPSACADGICVEATCGNDVLDPGEGCDDGNAVPTDDCTAACQPAACGDGDVEMTEEWCDGVMPNPCGLACDAQPDAQWNGTEDGACRMTLGLGDQIHLALASPTNRVMTFDASDALVWEVNLGTPPLGLATRADGELLVGLGSSASGSALRRIASDGTDLGEVALAPEQTDEVLVDIVVRGADTWVLSRNDSALVDGGHHVCRYDSDLAPVWCQPLAQDDDATNEYVGGLAVRDDGLAAVAITGQQSALWLLDGNGGVVANTPPETGPNAVTSFAGDVAFSPDGQTLAVAWNFFQSPGYAMEWSLYDLDLAPLRHAEAVIRDVYGSQVGWLPNGDLVIATVVDSGSQYPFVRIEAGDGELRHARRGSSVPGSLGNACDVATTSDQLIIAGTTTLSDRWFVTRFGLATP